MLVTYFSWKYNPCIMQKGHGNNGNDHQLKIISIDKQILLVSALENVWKQ